MAETVYGCYSLDEIPVGQWRRLTRFQTCASQPVKSGENMLMNKAKLIEHKEISRRLAKGLSPHASNSLIVVTDSLVNAWDKSVSTPLPQNLLDLCKALEDKLDALPQGTISRSEGGDSIVDALPA
ncbi:MAG: hypothetical protein EOO77_20570 [Oxalobacteraceae bacterium]|nr:MAG: hypothetical protein EOO77_20570 [Oxalobacteraceae bacterium]